MTKTKVKMIDFLSTSSSHLPAHRFPGYASHSRIQFMTDQSVITEFYILRERKSSTEMDIRHIS